MDAKPALRASLRRAPEAAPARCSPAPRFGAAANDARSGGAPAAVPQGRIDALDGLRAVSIGIVLFGHGAHTANAPALIRPLGEMGIVGVELFFTISGFIITWLLLRERERSGRVDLRAFWLRRALRIVPPFAAAALGIAIAAAAGLVTWSWPSFFGALTLTKNTTLLPGDWFFGHIWSLSLEEQFYLLWPLVFALALSPARVTTLLAVLVLGSVLLTPLTVGYLKPLQNVLPYLPHLAAGCLLAMALHAPRRPAWLAAWIRVPRRGLVLGGLVVTALVVAWLRGRDLDDHLSWLPLYALLIPVTSLLVVAEIALPDGCLRRALAVPPLLWLGRISYSLYLWQQLFLGPADAYRAASALHSWPYNLVAAVACGAFGYYCVEKPAARLRRRLQGATGDAGGSARAEPTRFGHDSRSRAASANARPGSLSRR
ncbi:acyltransferase family protein [Solimonas soli]|uniref:acyltransferase family protein n=1 Tax=Solimonas soli TaxID=413479 RepID=UPI0004894ADA|nr:acyltransferase [Solimonas soli]